MKSTLPPMDFAKRVARLRDRFDRLAIDALAVTNLTNVRWLTGFTGSNAAVLVGGDSIVLSTDGRYADQAPTQLAQAGVEAEVVIGADVIAGLIGKAGQVHKLGLESDSITWDQQRRFAEGLGCRLVAVLDELVQLRAIKDAGELARVRTAATITDATLAEVAPTLADRPSEREVAMALDAGLRRRGAAGSAYDTIVASGPNGALPHATPTDRVITPGDLVVIDVGSLVDGYRSDMTRTFIVGEPTELQLRQIEVVREAQSVGVDVVRAGVSAREVDTACRQVIIDAGWGERFTHGTGHGVGLDIHEQPRLNSRTTDTLEEGMLVTVEPGVYLPGEGGVRWEDLLHVTGSGAECLSGSPKAPLLEA